MTYAQFYAEEIEAVAGLTAAHLVAAFAAVPRERFLGPGPWTARGEGEVFGPPRTTSDADPKRVYHNLAIAIDASRQLFNGVPSLLAAWMQALGVRPGARVLHVGAGTGYYTAVMAEAVGADGHVEAWEVDAALASRARDGLADRPNVLVYTGDAAEHSRPFDVVLVNAGATHPRPSWLDALAPGGRLLVPLTVTMPPGAPVGKGFALLVERPSEPAPAAMGTVPLSAPQESDMGTVPMSASYPARFLNMVAIYNAAGARDPAIEARLGQAMARGDFMTVRRLRRDAHDEGAGCWLHTPGFCLSRE
ncbi:MAG: protein-L-isoaspartate O-methyltransferase [Vicinamibacterales bacterium]